MTYRHGDPKAMCQVCGFIYHLSELRRQWDGKLVCRSDWSPRHPQDFVRAVADVQRPRRKPSPEPADVFLTANQVTRESL
jgi:hypothetical protein